MLSTYGRNSSFCVHAVDYRLVQLHRFPNYLQLMAHLYSGFLYVFAFCLYALGSRNWGEESADASMRSWCSSAFEPSHPSRQIIVVQAPETKTRRAPGVFDLPPPIFTDCRCGWHTIHPTDLTTSDSQNSKMSV